MMQHARRLILCTLVFAWFLAPAAGHAAGACSTSTASLNGSYAMLVNGSATGSAGTTVKYFAGALTFNGAGSVSAQNVYDQSNADNTATGTYSVNADCTVTLTLTVQSYAAQTYVLALRQSANEAVGIETDGSAVATIDLQAQSSTPTSAASFTNATLNGTYAASCFGTSEITSDTNLTTYSNGLLSGTDPFNNGGSSIGTANVPYTGNYSVNSDGTFTGSATVLGSLVFDFHGVLAGGGSTIEYFYSGVTGTTVGTAVEACVGGLASAPSTPAPTAQSITFGSIGSQSVGTPVSLVATASSALAVSFASATAGVCSVSGSTATLLAGGTCIIVASQPGNATYAPATEVAQSFNVSGGSLASQTITFPPIASQTVGTPVILVATASSALAVTFASSTTGVCTVSGATATLLAPGTCTIVASQGGNASYAPAPSVSQSFSVSTAGGGGGTGSATSVDLSATDDVFAFANNGSPNRIGIDGRGDSYSATLLGSSVTWDGQTFALGSTAAPSAVTGRTIPLPQGSYSALTLLGTGVNGNQPNQVFVVTYTDGSTAAFTQSLSDWGGAENYGASSPTAPGESIAAITAYRVTPSGTQNGPWYLYGYSFALNPAKTVKSLTLPNNARVVIVAVNLVAPAVVKPPVPVAVSLGSVADVAALAYNGHGNSGLDNQGYSYSLNLLGTSVTWNGVSFTLGSATAPSAVTSRTIPLPAGSFNTLGFLGTGTNGNQLNQTFVVTYTDGSTARFTQSLSDWGGAKNYGASSATAPGESIVATMAYRVARNGATQNGPWYLYGYSFALNPAKTVRSVTLPNNVNVDVIAVDLYTR